MLGSGIYVPNLAEGMNCQDQKSRKRRSDFTTAAKRKAFRYGSPNCVVDPLLSLLADVERLRRNILDALHDIGVQITSSSADGLCKPTEESACTQGSTAVESSDLLKEYGELAFGSRVEDKQELNALVIDGIFGWAESTWNPPVPPLSGELRRLLCASLAALDEEDCKLGIHCLSEGEPALQDFSAVAEGESSAKIGEIGEAGMQELLRWSKWFEKGLKSSAKCIFDFFDTITSSALPLSLLGQSQHRENEPESPAMSSPPPCIAGGRGLYLHRSRCHDALATCLHAAHNSFVTFEGAVECVVEEALSVHAVEQQYWDGMRKMSLEYDVLRGTIRRIQIFRRRLTSCFVGLES